MIPFFEQYRRRNVYNINRHTPVRFFTSIFANNTQIFGSFVSFEDNNVRVVDTFFIYLRMILSLMISYTQYMIKPIQSID